MKSKTKVTIGIGMMLIAGIFSNCKKETLSEMPDQNNSPSTHTMQFTKPVNSNQNPGEFKGIFFTQSTIEKQLTKYEYNWACSGLSKVDKIEFQSKVSHYQSNDIIVDWHTAPGDEITVNEKTNEIREYSTLKNWNEGGVNAYVRLKITMKDNSVIYSNVLSAEIFGLNKRICVKASCWP